MFVEIFYMAERVHCGRQYEVELKIEGEFSPEEPPPPCSNPDDPRYSDPGSAADFEIWEVSVEACWDVSDDELTVDWKPTGADIESTFTLQELDELVGLAAEAARYEALLYSHGEDYSV